MSSNKKRSKAMYGISRIDDPTHRTYAWRVSLRRNGKALVRNFPDKKYAGKRKALAAAKSHRDELLLLHPPIARADFANSPRKNNKSGVTGVCLVTCKYYLADGTERRVYYWEAVWPTSPGQHETVRYSVSTHGIGRAFELACEARRKGLSQVEGVFWAAERGAVAPQHQVWPKRNPESRRTGFRHAARRVERTRKRAASGS